MARSLVKTILAGIALGTTLILGSAKKAYAPPLGNQDNVPLIWEELTPKKKDFFLTQDSLNMCIKQAYNNVKKWPKEFDKRLYRIQLMQESSFNVYAESYAGAKGLGQLMKGTWSDYRDSADYKKYIFDPVKNLEVSLEHLDNLSKFCKKRHPAWNTLNLEDKRKTILACYNGGQGNVEKADWNLQSKKLSKETRDYADLIMSNYHNPKIKIKTSY